MNWLKKLSGASSSERVEEHAVIANFKLPGDQFPTDEEMQFIHSLTHELEKQISKANAGEYDGDEFGGGECLLYMYGKDADRLFEAASPILKQIASRFPGSAIKRYGAAGNPDAREELIVI